MSPYYVQVENALAGATAVDVLAAAREQVQVLDAALPIHDVSTTADLIDNALSLSRVSARLVVAFTTLAVLLASIGVYGLIGHSVAERSLELAIRSALGATRIVLVRRIVGDGLRLSCLAILPGIGAGAALARLLAQPVPGPGADPMAAGMAAAVVLVVGIVASGVPALRATSLNPASTLRG